MRNNNYHILRAARPVIFVLASLPTPITATLQTFKHQKSIHRVNNNHQNDCRPLVAFNSHQRGHYSTFQQEKQRKLTFLNVGRDSNSQDETIKISSSPIISKISAIAHKITSSKKAKGRAILLLVAFLYGTLNVTLRAIYASEGAPTASVLSLVRQCLSVLTFIPIIVSINRNNAAEMEQKREEDLGIKLGNTSVEEDESRPMWLAAAELAFWNCGAQGFINAGLLFSPAARASFLTQTSVVLTPVISAMAGESIESSVWGGCALALVGLFLISTSSSVDDSSVIDVATTSVFNQGDVMILLGALSWSTYILRTSQIANKYSELDLQFTKTAFLAGMYGLWFLSEALSTLNSGGTLLQLWSGFQSIPAWILLAYSAVGPGAIADLLQQQGQKEVTASESNIILCTESIFAAVCAFTLLGEVSSIQEVIGGLFIVVSAILASQQ
ncbi:hypothetical protein ACHAWT_006081 [Skeletonema menzelii]